MGASKRHHFAPQSLRQRFARPAKAGGFDVRLTQPIYAVILMRPTDE